MALSRVHTALLASHTLGPAIVMRPMRFRSCNRCSWVHRLMDLRHLRAFVAIVDAGGFGRAAVRLNLSQPALSRQIRALEDELDVRLFDRIGRRVQLTAEGDDLLRRARGLLTDADSSASGRGRSRVGRPVSSGWAPRRKRWRPCSPVSFRAIGGGTPASRCTSSRTAASAWSRGSSAATSTSRSRPRAMRGSAGARCSPLHVLAVLPKSHRLGRGAILEIAELADAPLLLPRRDFASREWFDAACQVAHMRPRVLLESGAPSTLVALAQAGTASRSFRPTFGFRAERLRAVPLVQRGAPIGRWLSLAWDPRRFLAPYAEQFVEELVGYARRALPKIGHARRVPPLPRPTESDRARQVGPTTTTAASRRPARAPPRGRARLAPRVQTESRP